VVESVVVFHQLHCLVDSVIVVRHPQLAADSEVVKRCTYDCSKWPIGFLRNCDIVPRVVEDYERDNAIRIQFINHYSRLRLHHLSKSITC
jgi:hypothetical protein